MHSVPIGDSLIMNSLPMRGFVRNALRTYRGFFHNELLTYEGILS